MGYGIIGLIDHDSTGDTDNRIDQCVIGGQWWPPNKGDGYGDFE